MHVRGFTDQRGTLTEGQPHQGECRAQTSREQRTGAQLPWSEQKPTDVPLSGRPPATSDGTGWGVSPRGRLRSTRQEGWDSMKGRAGPGRLIAVGPVP